MPEAVGKKVRQEGLDLGKTIFVSPPLPLLTILRAFFYLPDLLPNTERDWPKTQVSWSKVCGNCTSHTVIDSTERHSPNTALRSSQQLQTPPKSAEVEGKLQGELQLSDPFAEKPPRHGHCCQLSVRAVSVLAQVVPSVLSHCQSPSHQQLPLLKLLLEKYPAAARGANLFYLFQPGEK